MGVSYREEIRKRTKGTRAPNHSREQICDSRTRARDRKEYFRKSYKDVAKNKSAQKASQGRLM